MAASVNDIVLDKALDYIKNNADKITYCAGQPANATDADTLVSGGGNKLAEENVSAADYSGPAAGDTSGRKLTVDKTGWIADEGGGHDHVAYIDTSGPTLLAVHEADNGSGAALSLTAGLAYNLQATDILEIRAAQTT